MAKKAGSMQELNELHRLITKSFTQIIGKDLEDDVPTDAATLGAAIKFLKDNSVTADPADAEDLNELREKFKEAAARRKNRGLSVVGKAEADLSDDDLNVMQG